MAKFNELANNTADKWWKDPGLRKSFLHIITLYTAVYSLGYDGSLLNGLQALNEWNRDFDKPTGTKLGLIAASYYLPKIPLTFVIAWMVDRYGRKIGLYCGALFMFAGALLGGFCHSVAQLVGSRILLGVGTAAAQVTAAALVPELAHPRMRHYAGGFLNTTYYSPRWLVKKGRVDEAHEILATYHANGKMDDELVLLEMREIRASVELEKAADEASWLAWFHTKGNLRRFFVIIILGTSTQWVGNGVVQYYLVPVLKTVGINKAPQTAGVNGGLAVWNWFVSMTGASLVERFGRRPLFLTSIIGMFCSFIMILGLAGGYNTTHHSSTGIAMVPFIFVFMGFYSLALTPLPMLYVPEICPLALRAKAAALLLLAQNCAQSFNQFANPVALSAINWKYYAVYVAVDAVYIALYWFMIRETKGLTTEEAAVVYDPDDIKQSAMEAERRMHQEAHKVAHEEHETKKAELIEEEHA
ncbi:sugar transporter [Kwoniella heveanensis BCC8398]|uniref:Sugar transporter n=1 Tax=Kwoniella heveanensis BCC8398 TaxID=1296120 RepID=A0A1B9GSS9_9TREE|nr:sugar transporter [Kwoniella heveanensis BCC8398]